MDITLSSPYILTALILVSVEVSVAILTYAYITVAMLHDICKKKPMNHLGKIQLALLSSNFIFTIVSSANFLCDFVWPVTCNGPFSNDVFIILTIYSISSSAWLNAFLGFTFFSKVVDLKFNFFSWVKNKMNSVYVIIWVEVLCLAISFLSLLIIYSPQETFTNSSFLHPTNNTSGAGTGNLIVAKFILVLVLIPLLAVVIVSLVTKRFFKLQGQKMEMNMGQSREVSQKLYNNLVSRLIQIIIIHSLSYVVTFIFYFSVFSYQSFWYWVNMILMFSSTPTQFISFIHRSKVKGAWKEMSDNMMCCKQ